MIVLMLQIGLVGVTAWFACLLLQKLRAADGPIRPSLEPVALGAVTNFFDTLGIGSFAPSTAYIRMRGLTADVNIPAVLNLGHALPTVVQALIFISAVAVGPVLLATCIGSAVVGAVFGARVVARLPVRAIQVGMGIALLVAAGLMLMTNLGLFPAGGTAMALSGWPFWVAAGVHFVLGALMTLGIGLYAPSLITLSLLGLDPRGAFPVMMGACAFLMPIGGSRFFGTPRIDLPLIIAITIGGIPAVLVAAFVVKSLPLEVLRWLVVCVVLYAAVSLLLASRAGSVARAVHRPAGAPPPRDDAVERKPD